MEKTEYFNEIKIWDEHSKKHIYNATGILISKLKDKKDLVVVDVGANSGTYFDELNNSLDIKRAILFEVHPELYKYLKDKYSSQPHITVENIAMSDCVKGFTLNDVAFNYEIENNVGKENFNLGLSKINYSDDSEIKTNFFDNIKDRYNLEKIDILKIDTETEDLLVLKGFTETIKNLKQKPIIEFENNWWERYTLDESQKILDDFCDACGYVNDINLSERGDHFLYPKTEETESIKKKQNVTMVTGLWDLDRGSLEGWAKRDFSQYKARFFELLETDIPMVVWIPKDLVEEVKSIRGNKPTEIKIKEVEDFKTWNPFFEKIQEIRNNPEWKNFAGWLPDSPQAALEFYNPMMFTKMFMLNDSAIYNPFNTEYFFWIDGGLTSTVNTGYFTKERVLDNLDYYTELYDKFIHITYPYTANEEIHGFERKKMAEFCGVDFVNYVARGGFFGGKKSMIAQINMLYYNVMETTLKSGYMGADECLFTILCHKYPNLIHRFEIEGNGLVWPFFENLVNIKDKIKKTTKGLKPFSEIKTSLYVLTYNSPSQFETLVKSFEKVDKNFLDVPRKILLNNSLDRTTDSEYNRICSEYGFEMYHKDNIGICGGRQWIAEHFDESDSDFYIFFEDDMFLHEETTNLCMSGFPRHKKDLFKKTLRIVYENNYDYLKLSFSEFYGDNKVQWAWYNVPQNVRQEYFPEKTQLPIRGLDPDAPKTKFNVMKQYQDISFLEGEVHYCNWPLWMSRNGNYKVFLETKWAHPFEQTWMSNAFQMIKKGELNPAVLLLSPINHDRFEHYGSGERREN